MNHLKQIDRIGSFGIDLITLSIGVLFLTARHTGWVILYVLIVVLSLLSTVRMILSLRSGAKPAAPVDYAFILFNLIFAVSILIRPDHFIYWLHTVFGWWMLGRGILMLINFYVCLRDQLPGAFRQFANGFVSVILALLMIAGRNIAIKNNVLSIIAAVYFIGYGLLGFVFHLTLILKERNPAFRSFSFSAPVLFSSLMPLEMYVSIRRLKLDSRLEITKEPEPVDLYVYIYLKGKGPELFGHIDLSFKGTIWSYGNHDPNARRMNGTLGDGVLIEAAEAPFLQEAIEEGKTVIGYGIRLKEEQKRMVEKRIAMLMERTVPWKCPAAQAEESGSAPASCNDYASRVYKATHCRMYKFTHGKFRTYFISSTNCVILADEILRCDDLQLVDLNGLVTPGAYLSFLNTEYLRKQSPVVSRVLYEEGVHEPLPKP